MNIATQEQEKSTVLNKQAKLLALSEQINTGEEAIESKKAFFVMSGRDLLKTVCAQGQLLSKAKSILRHSDWDEWLAIHCPKTKRMANAYMRAATIKVTDLIGIESLRHALQLTFWEMPKEIEPKVRPPFAEAHYRVGKFVDYVQRNPITDWPEPYVRQVREELEPIAKSLWPERFV